MKWIGGGLSDEVRARECDVETWTHSPVYSFMTLDIQQSFNNLTSV